MGRDAKDFQFVCPIRCLEFFLDGGTKLRLSLLARATSDSMVKSPIDDLLFRQTSEEKQQGGVSERRLDIASDYADAVPKNKFRST